MLTFVNFSQHFSTSGTNDTGSLALLRASTCKLQHTDRHGMQYAILYVNSPPFVAALADWPTAVNQWIGYMSDPAYATVNGKPLLIVIDMGNMRQTFGSSAAVASALNQLRKAAVACGMPGVYVIGGFQSG